MALDSSLAAKLTAKGWRYSPGQWYTCRICKYQIPPWKHAWFSPKRTVYHEHCLSYSPLALKDMKEKK